MTSDEDGGARGATTYDATQPSAPSDAAAPAPAPADAAATVPVEERALAEAAARIKNDALQHRPVPTAPPPVPSKNEQPEFDRSALTEGKLKPTRTWYGWQILIADAASATLFGVGAATGSSEATTAGIIGYLAAPAVVHFAHKRVGVGFGSFGIRVGGPLAGALTGLLACASC
ncbi:MAG TPA: hypothetical protein VGJ84_23945, partial [Polyangiaceae bacterium]